MKFRTNGQIEWPRNRLLTSQLASMGPSHHSQFHFYLPEKDTRSSCPPHLYPISLCHWPLFYRRSGFVCMLTPKMSQSNGDNSSRHAVSLAKIPDVTFIYSTVLRIMLFGLSVLFNAIQKKKRKQNETIQMVVQRLI